MKEPIDIREYSGAIVVMGGTWKIVTSNWSLNWRDPLNVILTVLDFKDGRNIDGVVISQCQKIFGCEVRWHNKREWTGGKVTTPDGTPLVVKT